MFDGLKALEKVLGSFGGLLRESMFQIYCMFKNEIVRSLSCLGTFWEVFWEVLVAVLGGVLKLQNKFKI